MCPLWTGFTCIRSCEPPRLHPQLFFSKFLDGVNWTDGYTEYMVEWYTGYIARLKGGLMSIKQGILALLDEGPKYGAQLKAEFEARTGNSWPLNVGQVYTTLGRLERDGLVIPAGKPDEDGKIAYQLTDDGRKDAQSWWTTPVLRSATPRDELVIKIAMAVAAPGVDITNIVDAQRDATMTHLRDLTKRKRHARKQGNTDDTAHQGPDEVTLVVLENLIYAAEGEIRWLDHVETVAKRIRSDSG